MRTALSFEFAHDEVLPARFADDVRTPPALIEHVLQEVSDPGDAVLDAFAGFGTTLVVAERLGRVPYGLEYEPERVEYVRGRVDAPDNIRQGDVLDFEPSAFPTCECCVTSPPFMERTDDRNPFRNYAGESSYEAYLDDVETAFRNIRHVLTDGSRVVVSVANIKYKRRVTPLAWDIADRLSSVFHFDGEIVITWEGVDDGDSDFGYGYDHSYCLLFTNER